MSDHLTSPTEAAAAPRRGCLGKGCLTFVVLVALFSTALVGGGVWALRSFRAKYSSPEPLDLPRASRGPTISRWRNRLLLRQRQPRPSILARR
jgi:hypothetical protein